MALDKISDTIKLILELRLDLKDILVNGDEIDKWVILSGRKEYLSIDEDNQIHNFFLRPDKLIKNIDFLQSLIYKIREDIRPQFDPHSDPLSYKEWFYNHAIFEHELFNLLNYKELKNYYNKDSLNIVTSQYLKKNIKNSLFNEREFGVNLFGSAYGEFGLGEDMRMMGRSLLRASIPYNMIDFSPNGIANNDISMKKHVGNSTEFAFNIFCMSPLEHGRFFAVNGSQHFKNRYNIGYWPWELQKWPKQWDILFNYVDEIWVHTKFIYDALKNISPVPVRHMPPSCSVSINKKLKRRDFDLPDNMTLFCFSFDHNSSLYRKNPEGCINAFLLAFPVCNDDSDKVGLVIKTHANLNPDPFWAKLKEIARHDKRIFIIEETYDRSTLLSFYSLCDCFISLHRAEGYGRGIAEALLLGLSVITTGYSGNLDFCNTLNCKLVDFKLVPVKKGEYFYFENQVWAEPNINHAADLMKQFYRDKNYSFNNKFLEVSSHKQAGINYLSRLDKLYRTKSVRKVANQPFPRIHHQ